MLNFSNHYSVQYRTRSLLPGKILIGLGKALYFSSFIAEIAGWGLLIAGLWTLNPFLCAGSLAGVGGSRGIRKSAKMIIERGEKIVIHTEFNNSCALYNDRLSKEINPLCEEIATEVTKKLENAHEISFAKSKNRDTCKNLISATLNQTFIEKGLVEKVTNNSENKDRLVSNIEQEILSYKGIKNKSYIKPSLAKEAINEAIDNLKFQPTANPVKTIAKPIVEPKYNKAITNSKKNILNTVLSQGESKVLQR